MSEEPLYTDSNGAIVLILYAVRFRVGFFVKRGEQGA